jgi:phospholipase/lecithinase/hemolysin
MGVFPLVRATAMVAGLLLAAGSPGASTAASNVTSRFASTVTFGDSLVDAGNYFIASGGTYPDAAEGFFEGRNTNGYDYTDLLSQKISGVATTASLAGGDNYAFGGARVLGGVLPDFATQISQYQAHLAGDGRQLDTGALFTITFGDNDVGAIDAGDYGGYGSRDAALEAVAGQYAAGIQQLAEMGAQNILFTGFLYLDTQTSHDLEGLLGGDLAKLALPAGINLYGYSIQDFFQRAATDPTSLGLPSGLDTTTPCRAAGAAPDCSHYLFYDGDHPTSAAHQAMLDDMNDRFGLFDQAQAVPEPATWVMMIVGFGFAGLSMRRRRTAVPVDSQS